MLHCRFCSTGGLGGEGLGGWGGVGWGGVGWGGGCNNVPDGFKTVGHKGPCNLLPLLQKLGQLFKTKNGG